MYRKYNEPEFMPGRTEMLKIIEEHIVPGQETEFVPLDEAFDRVCGEDIYSKNTLPGSPVSRLDGIGVRFADFANGIPDTSAWQEGKEYYFSNTGVALKKGYDTVIIIEEIDIDDSGKLIIHTPPKEKGEYVGKIGQQMCEGELLCSRGTLITPMHIGLLASGGIMKVPVLKKPTVAIVPTGNELVSAGLNVPKDKNVESNSHMLSAYLRSWGANPVVYPLIEDDTDTILKTMERAIEVSDMVLIIAGSSKGTMDYTMDVLKQLGDIVVEEMGHGPGRHSTLTMADGKPVVGIAGPPVGAQMFSVLYLHYIVRLMLLQRYESFEEVEVTFDVGLPVHDVDFCQRLQIIRKKDGYHTATAFKGPMSTLPQSVNEINAFLYQVKGTGFNAGEKGFVELLVNRAFIPNE